MVQGEAGRWQPLPVSPPLETRGGPLKHTHEKVGTSAQRLEIKTGEGIKKKKNTLTSVAEEYKMFYPRNDKTPKDNIPFFYDYSHFLQWSHPVLLLLSVARVEVFFSHWTVKHNGKHTITPAVFHYWLWVKLFTRLLTGTVEKEKEGRKGAGSALLLWICASTPLNGRLTSYDGRGLR